MANKNNLAIFDLDGTLFHTDDANFHAYKDAFSSYGIHLDYGYFCKKCSGRHYTTFLPALMENELDMEKVHRLKKNAYVKYLDQAAANEHLFRMIRLMRREYHIAVVTTASRKNTYEILNAFKVLDFFDLILTAEDVTKVKPDPEGFIKAMEFFHIDASQTLIFEDSDAGIEAALRSRAAVLRVESFA